VSGPLDGVLVVDLSRILAGPFCTMLLADLGARVVKVEAPEGGDVTRAWGPPWDPATGLSAYYLSVNRNKESIVLDLAAEAGREAVRILARRADVVVENFPPGGLEKFGLPLAAMRSENPRLVTASITGYGRAGPDASAPGFDLLAQAGSGLMAITGTPDGPATKVGVAISDLLAGAFAATGIAAALFCREASGRGAHVEIDLFRSSLAALVNVGQASLLTGEEAKRHGNAHPQIVPYRTFAASDGDFVIAAGTDPQFARLAGVVGRPEWGQDPRYRTNPARVENRRELEGALEDILRSSPREMWLDRCRAAGVPAGPVRGPLEALTSEGARATGAVLSAGGLSFLATPVAVEGHRARLDFPPALDADGERLRREFGLSAKAASQ
jgi:crotonobetainyl-CoA:carnitine CoA-transferase CaiB-like acyl-CoA transferase